MRILNVSRNMITAEQIKNLREQTGAGVMECKQALGEARGDVEKAIAFLRKAGKQAAQKKQSREACEGVVGSYVHSNGKIASLVVLNCETDFVARNEEFKRLAKDLAMQVAAMSPRYVSPDDVPEEVKEKEREIYREHVAREGKPPEIAEKIVEGKLQKFYSEVCLTKQSFIKDEKMTIEDVVTAATAKLGEKIVIREISRLSV